MPEQPARNGKRVYIQCNANNMGNARLREDLKQIERKNTLRRTEQKQDDDAEIGHVL